MAKKKPKFYVVWEGKTTGVFSQWSDCQAAISGFSSAKYMSFESRALAEAAYNEGPADYWGKKNKSKRDAKPQLTPEQLAKIGMPIEDALCVDAACSGKTMEMEYRGVWYRDRSVYFAAGPHPRATNNLGEFLAIVHGLALMMKEGNTAPIYTDSKIAMAWVAKKQVRSQTQSRGETSAGVNQLVSRAVKWLIDNQYPNPILKWHTDVWGEIPADYGRK